MYIASFILMALIINTSAYVVVNDNNNSDLFEHGNNTMNDVVEDKAANAFDGVYSECFLYLSYTCIQRKTLSYLNELNLLSEVSVFGDHLKFVKFNKTTFTDGEVFNDKDRAQSSHDLSALIDKAVDNFFDKHVLRVSALGRDISVPRTVEEFVGRKRRKGGGGGGGGGDGGHGDGGKKKMMMMVMMCMKMKLMMMIPAMMGMMGMMSFKGMMFSMMSFMISKMMLLMKILEKKNGGGGGGAGDGGGWAAGGGGGGAWMPAGGQDYGGGGGGAGAGGGGGYDANGQWQSRSIPAEYTQEEFQAKPFFTKAENLKRYGDIGLRDISDEIIKYKNAEVKTKIKRSITDNNLSIPTEYVRDEFQAQSSFTKPENRYDNIEHKNLSDDVFRFNNEEVKRSIIKNDVNNQRQSLLPVEYMEEEYKAQSLIKANKGNIILKNKRSNAEVKSRKERSIMDVLQNAYLYWTSKLLGYNVNRPNSVAPKYKVVNGVKYVYYPMKYIPRVKTPKLVQPEDVDSEDTKTIITAQDFNKGEIVEGGFESRTRKKGMKKFHKMKKTVDDALDESPWQ